MNYTELKQNVQDIIENSFTEDQLAMFTQQAENKIYQTVSLPSMRRNQTGVVTTNNPYLTKPTGFLNVYSMAVINDGTTYLLPKDVSFVREAFPFPAVTGRPQYYGLFDEDTFILGPTPNDDYTIEMHYAAYPESIVTAGNTWLGDNFDTALLNGALIEAARFVRAEVADIANYEKLYLLSMQLLADYAKTKITGDEYRGYGG